MSYKVNLLEEMPNALFYLIESVEALQSKVNALQHKQASNSPKWVDIDELCAYLSSHPVKQTVYGWGSAKQIPVHKINKALVFLQSEIDDWLKNKSHKTVSKPEQSVKVDYDEKTVYNGIAKSFCTCERSLVSGKEIYQETTDGHVTIFTMVPETH